MAELIAVDLGTTLIKCTLYDENGTVLAAESLPCCPTYPRAGWVVQDAWVWYEGVCQVLARLNAFRKQDTVGIAVSSQGQSVVPVDENFHPLCPALSWLDNRAEAETAALATLVPREELFRCTGKFLSPAYTLPKLLWLKNNMPQVFSAAHKFLLPMDYLHARLTGCAVTDHTVAAGNMCYEVAAAAWSEELLALVGLTPDRMAEIRPSGALVGELNEETLRLTGLPAGTRVFNGGHDQKAASYAAGINARRASLALGTAGALEIFVAEPTKQNQLPFFPYVVPDKMLLEGVINTTGAAIGWIKNTLFADVDYDRMNEMAAQAPIGCGGLQFYPHLAKPGTPNQHMDVYGSINGLSLFTGRGELIRSLYEGLAYEFRLNLEAAARAGSQTKELIAFGGASRSSVFCQIIADVTGLAIYTAQNSELSSAGAAKLAAAGMGLDAEAFGKGALGSETCYLPDPETAAAYEPLYQKYIQYYQ